MYKEVTISIKNLVVRFKNREHILTAIRNISFDIYQGEVLAIVGESGSGKSVLTKLFTNMLDKNGWASSGRITYIPSKDNINDQNCYFKQPIQILDYQKILLEKELRKSVVKTNKKLIKSSLKQLKLITNFNEQQIKSKIVSLKLKSQQTKAKISFSHQDSRTNRKLNKLNELHEIWENFQTIISNPEKKELAIKQVNTAINDYKLEIRNIKNLSIKEKIKISNNIKILENFHINNVKPNNNKWKQITTYLEKKQFSQGVGYRLIKLNKGLQENIKYDEDFKNIVKEWSLNKSFNFINKRRVNKEINKLRGHTIATIFQDPMTSLNPLLSVGFQIAEVIRKHQKLSRVAAKKEAIDLLEKVGISNAKKRYHDIPGMYSGGMRQRVVIAIALACKPKILICDEPTTALDVTIQTQIIELIKQIQAEYKFTVIFITHDLGVVANVADRVAVMYAGQIVEYGTIKEIFFNSQHPYTWALLSSLPQLGEKGKDLFFIPGSPPSLYSKINGDPFAARNVYAMKIDYLKEPPMFKVTNTHFAKTWLLDKRAPKVEKPKQLKNLINLNNEIKGT